MRRVLLGLSAISCLFAIGCSPEAPRPSEHVREVPLGIFNGTADTTHKAVVAIFSNTSVCSGTIVAVVGDEGYVLTAAHCLEDTPLQVVFTDDYNNAPLQNNVVTSQAHPSYSFPDYDFAMIKFSGATPQTPVIPPMTAAEDNLVGNETVEFVGYGTTEDNFNNSVRMHVSGPLDGVDALHLSYGQATGGPCSGDSGGPSLSPVGGQQHVSGVTSYGDEACVDYGVSGRVSAVNADFIQVFIASGGMGGQTCGQCQQAETSPGGACAGSVDTCFNNAACADLAQCINNCNDDACVDACAAMYPAGVTLYNAIFDCLCGAPCGAECVAECGGTSTTSSSSTSTSNSSGSTGSTGVGGAGSTSAGAGANDSSGTGNDDDNDNPSEKSGCRVGPTGASSPATALGILGLLAGLGGLRRRARARLRS